MLFVPRLAKSLFNPLLYRQSMAVTCGAALLALASQASIPWTPVPLTFQSVTVVAIGLFCGSRLSSYSILLYLLSGLLGLPVFANGASGPLVFLGPTAGYLIGFLPAAYVSGLLVEKNFAQKWISTFLCSVIGVLPIFLCGIFILSTLIGLEKAYLLGFKPFLYTELGKLFIVSLFASRFNSKLKN